LAKYALFICQLRPGTFIPAVETPFTIPISRTPRTRLAPAWSGSAGYAPGIFGVGAAFLGEIEQEFYPISLVHHTLDVEMWKP
jgi:hypothetical protein